MLISATLQGGWRLAVLGPNYRLFLSLSLSHTLTHPLSHTLSLSLAHTHTHTHTHSLSISLSHTHSLTHARQGWHSPSTAEISLSGPTSGSKTITLTPEKNEVLPPSLPSLFVTLSLPFLFVTLDS